MKVILAGSSGFIGKEILRQCLQNPSINSLIALSRRPLAIKDPKLKTILVEDFNFYSPSVLEELSNADSCIWTLGVITSDIDIQKKVTLGFTLAAAEAFTRPSDTLSDDEQSPRKLPFRFVFASGALAVRDQSKSLWFMSGARRIKGDAENKLLDFTAEHEGVFDAFVVRPGLVLASGGGLAGVAVRMGAPAVSLGAVAAVMVDLALRGGEQKVLENAELVSRGMALLRTQERK